ncbi:putative nitrilase cyanide hydratase conserved site [Diaporthe ampelina]|uniref:Putative nitrilase cyanide hydratase conserved site n=1 Tax=Diaporthe ampelina TaxID=1214573 RepID=A0A0G2FQ54_9PEZI|nr:putative nitrilase cyanide hydratase conserved site [Diaporthe ampelina]
MAVPRFKLKVAAAHMAPVYMDKEATTKKAIDAIRDAGAQGVELLAFPETFIPGYPYFVQAYPPLLQTSAIAQYAEQSVVCDSSDPSIRAIQDACREAGVTVSLGVSERMGGGYTLFNSQVHIDSSGSILGVHRKLQPTHAERYVWAQGDGSTLRVWPVDAGGGRGSYNLGGLCCWENTFNGARQALVEQNQHIHVGAWPSLSTMKGFEDVADAQIEALMRAHALTAQVFVLTVANPVDDSCLEWMEKNLGKQDLLGK